MRSNAAFLSFARLAACFFPLKSLTESVPMSTPPEIKSPQLTDLHRKFLDSFYKHSGVTDLSDTGAKILVLQNKLGATSFHAWGGRETPEMELNTLEFVYLTEAGQV